jgi:hypothetical protein
MDGSMNVRLRWSDCLEDKVTTRPLARRVAASWFLAVLLCFVAGLVAACKRSDPSISAMITAQFDASSSVPVNLGLVGPSSWDRVCVLGPYSTNEDAERVLGFKWDLERETSINLHDSFNVLVFIHNNMVVAFTEHPRHKGDFRDITPRCLERSNAILVRQVRDEGVQLVLK